MRIFTLAMLVLVAAACENGDAGQAPAPDSAATVIAVLDGDSLRLDIDGEEIEARLVGINAPERNECFADRSRDEVVRLTGEGPLEFRPVTNQRDQFGRVLGSLAAAGGDIGAALVSSGLAIALDVDHPDRAELLEAEDEARRAGAGLWASDACGPASAVRLEVTGITANPPGPDEDVLTDELVEITNRGDRPADLSGYVLRDESSRHRFTFPGGATVGPGATLRIRTGCADDTGSDLYWCAGGPVWNNGGDLVMLHDRNGSVVAARRYP